MARKVVVTGGGGFVGQWLTRALLRSGDDVTIAELGPAPSTAAVLTADELRAVRWIPTDVRREPDVATLVEGAPDLIVHLAGMSFVPDAEAAPEKAFDVNVLGCVRLLAAVSVAKARGAADPTVLVVGSSTQYGAHPAADMPLTEDAEQRPQSVYAATKTAQEVAALQYARTSGLRIICTRSFSHAGRGQAPSFLLPSLVERTRRQTAAKPTLAIGNDVIRDYLHVDDVVSAYLALADRGQAGEVYNVCSGAGVSIRELAVAALARSGSDGDVATDQALQRASDMPVLIGSREKLTRTTGWAPTKSYGDIFDDLFAAV